MAGKKTQKNFEDLLFAAICSAILCLFANYESQRKSDQNLNEVVSSTKISQPTYTVSRKISSIVR